MKKLLYIDLFCGAGGTSTGVNTARLHGEQCAEVIACVNHDANAIASHAANHPDALHFTEDIRTLELSPLVHHLQKCRTKNPDALVVLWASLECTNFSRAKGGQPRDADSRTLAEHLFRYIEAIDPDYIQIENVEEFMSWGELDENGKPVSKDRGKSYIKWVNNVKKYGYNFTHRILNAADFGAYTSRKRFFGIFAKNGLPVVFLKQTHCKTGAASLFGTMPKWKPVREVLDFEDEGKSIFNRKKPLAEKTLERIYAGLIKFVAGGKDAFMVKYNSMNQRGKYVPPSLDEPCPTIATQQRLALASVSFLSKQFSGQPDSKNVSVEEPAGTITTIDHHAFVKAQFIVNYRFNNTGHSIEDPAQTICTVGQIGVASCSFIANEYSGGGQLSSIEQPNPAVLTNPKQKLVTVKQHYLMNPQFASNGGSVDKPCFTLIARMDKMPPYLVTTETGEVAIEVYETDSPMTVKIKEFMALYNIIDITMRMLKIDELKVSYGGIEAVKGITFEVPDGKIVTLIGANGAGKSTTLRSIAGLVKPAHGRIHLQGEDITALSPDRIVSKGITLVPEGRHVFPDLTVLENLKIGAYLRKDSLEDDLNWVYELFPRLKERSWQAAGTLSGGEQQMLAVGRALMSRPKIIMMDEPSLGLAPIVVKGIFDIIQEINKQGVTVLLIEQNANMALRIADVGYVLETGRITLTGSGRELLTNEAVKKAYLGT